MNREALIDSIDHDASLVTEFLQLTPAQRLAQLDSHIDFFTAARRAADEQLYPDSRDPRPPRG